MKILIVLCAALLCVTAAVLIFLHFKSGRPLRSVFIHAAIGLLFLAAVNLTCRYTGIKIPVNAYSAVSAAVLGAPAVCGFLILNLIL